MSTTTATKANALRDALADLVALTTSDLVKLWRQYGDLTDFPLIVGAAFPELIAPYLGASGLFTATWYDELAPALSYTAVAVTELPTERLKRSVEWALFAPHKNTTSLDTLAGSAQRMVFDVSRQTVLDNLDFELGPTTDAGDRATRYARHASATACKFCKMLASRGAVYRSSGVVFDDDKGAHRTVVRGRSASLTRSDRRRVAGGYETRDEILDMREKYAQRTPAAQRTKGAIGALRGSRSHGERYHDHCHCIAVPVRPGTRYEAPDYVHSWDE